MSITGLMMTLIFYFKKMLVKSFVSLLVTGIDEYFSSQTPIKSRMGVTGQLS